MTAPRRLMREASQRGTCPPCNGKSAPPARCGMRGPGGRAISFTICTTVGNVQASKEISALQCADALRNWTQGFQDQAAALNPTSMARSASKQLVVCVGNDGYPASLEKRKLYVMLLDPAAEKQGLLRVIDESGEDNLYPKSFCR